MSDVRECPTCGSPAKYKEVDGSPTYKGVTDEERSRKIEQLKKAMQKFKQLSEDLQLEIEQLKNKSG